jgi:hypothetical protein
LVTTKLIDVNAKPVTGETNLMATMQQHALNAQLEKK